MSAEKLRQAAALMRERAEAATPSPWVLWVDGIYRNPEQNDQGWLQYDARIAEVGDDPDDFVTEPDADHIASWHPAVALAVADWLDHAAESADLNRTPYVDDHYRAALKVATAYLGADQ